MDFEFVQAVIHHSKSKIYNYHLKILKNKWTTIRIKTKIRIQTTLTFN